MIDLILVEDHEMVRFALARTLEGQSDLKVAGQLDCAESCWDFLLKQPVDVVVTDLELPGQSGRQLALRLLDQNPNQGIVVLSYRVDPAEVRFLVQAGVRGYVPKSQSADELVKAIRAVAIGQHYFAGQAASALAQSMRHSTNESENPLTVRQSVILQHLSKGLTTREIAEQMCLSPKTIEKYRGEILRKLNCKNQFQALEVARRLQLIECN